MTRARITRDPAINYEHQDDRPPASSPILAAFVKNLRVLLRRHREPADGASPVHRQPHLDAARVEPVPARHLPRLVADRVLLQADRAIAALLAVLRDRGPRQRVDRGPRRRRRARFDLEQGAEVRRGAAEREEGPAGGRGGVVEDGDRVGRGIEAWLLSRQQAEEHGAEEGEGRRGWVGLGAGGHCCFFRRRLCWEKSGGRRGR